MSVAANEDVLVARHGRVLVITLNRPKTLNALSLAMIRVIEPQLRAAATDPAIRCVLIEGVGERAFCAGGDVRAVIQSLAEPSSTMGADFFREEYRLNRLIHGFPKPFVALVRGISMGGGVGLSVHGSHRVVTESLMMAMPETGIGLFPDVGATFFLTRCPGLTGLYLALTGARIGAADARYVGYATHQVADRDLGALRQALIENAPADDRAVEAVIARFATEPSAPALDQLRPIIDRCFSAPSVEEIQARLASDPGEWARTVAADLAHKSPTSLKVTFRQITEGRHLDIDEVLRREYRMSQACLAGHDFREGIRALLIDKDNRPAWRPASLAEVTDQIVDRHFAPPPVPDWAFS